MSLRSVDVIGLKRRILVSYPFKMWDLLTVSDNIFKLFLHFQDLFVDFIGYLYVVPLLFIKISYLALIFISVFFVFESSTKFIGVIQVLIWRETSFFRLFNRVREGTRTNC